MYITLSWGSPSSIARQTSKRIPIPNDVQVRLRKALGDTFPTPTLLAPTLFPTVEISTMGNRPRGLSHTPHTWDRPKTLFRDLDFFEADTSQIYTICTVYRSCWPSGICMTQLSRTWLPAGISIVQQQYGSCITPHNGKYTIGSIIYGGTE